MSENSAKYTECIHTGFPLGIGDPICKVDFYLNGGLKQPGCVAESGVENVVCSHSRAVEVFIESLSNPKAFPGYPCIADDSTYEPGKLPKLVDCKTDSEIFINDNRNNELLAEKESNQIYRVTTESKSDYGLG